MHIEIRTPFDCNPARYWEVFLDPDVTTRLHQEVFGSSAIEIVSQKGALDTGLERTLRYAQQPNMPGPVKRIFGAQVTMTEEGRFDPATSTWTYTLVPATMAGRTEIKGVTRVDGAGASDKSAPKSCEEQFSLDAVVRILGAGPIAERFIAQQARQSHDRSVIFLQQQIAGTKPKKAS